MARKIREAGLTPSGEHRGNPTFTVKDVAAALYGNPAAGHGADPDSLPPHERKAWYDSEARRLDVEARQRELIPVVEVERVVSTAFAAIASDLRSIPDNLERKHGLPGEVVRTFEDGLLAAMDALADRLAELSEEPTDD
jgi:hypothetical protein